MKLREVPRSALLVVAAVTGTADAQSATIGWPEAVARLAGERSKAETCVAQLKRDGNRGQISSGQGVYVNAKADIDAVIAGLIVTLAQDARPADFPSLETKLARGTSGLLEFCKTVNDLAPQTPGTKKNFIVDIVKAALEPLIKSLTEGVSALYNNSRKDDEIVRRTIQTQLEAAKWPTFGDVKAAE